MTEPAAPQRILVVEDDADSLANTSLLLQLEGFAVLTATNGLEGLARINADRPELIVCDWLMPQMDGMCLLATVRAQPLMAATPFLFLTGLADYSRLRSAMNAGADDYLTKPYTPADLLGAVRTRLKRLTKPPASHLSAILPATVASLTKLSTREQEIVALIGTGLSSQRIADRLDISRRTVDSHRAHIIDKLDLGNASELIRLAAILRTEPG